MESSKLTDTQMQIRNLINEAFSISKANPQRCIEISREALTIAQREHLREEEGQSLMHIGVGLFNQGKDGEAINYFQQATTIFDEVNYYYGLRCCYTNIGLVYQKLADDDKAIEYFQKNMALQDCCNMPALNTNLLINIGRCYTHQTQFDKAREILLQALDNTKKFNLKHFESVARNNLASVEQHTGNYRRALELHISNIDIMQEVDDMFGLCRAYLQMATIYLKLDNLHEAETYLHKSIKLNEKVGDISILANIHHAYARMYRKCGDLENEQKHLESALVIAKEVNSKSSLIEIMDSVIDFRKRNGDFEAALKMTEEYITLLDQQFDEKRNRLIQETSTRLEVERFERESRLLREKNQELEQKNDEIEQQNEMLEKAEEELQRWNQELEERVQKEIERRNQQEQFVIQKSKLESLGRMAAGIAHEINQPLGLIQLGIDNLFQSIERGLPSKKYLQDKSNYLDQNIDRIKQIIEHIRIFSREQNAERFQRFNVSDVINKALSMIEVQYKNHNIAIERDFKAEETFAFGNPHRFEQVILNLLVNARDALNSKYDQYDDGQRIGVTLFNNEGSIQIEIEDNGVGIPETIQNHIFEPFFTTKDEQKGTGLGLSISYGIIQEMNGDIRCETESGEYTRMIVTIPEFIAETSHEKAESTGEVGNEYA